MVKARAVCFNNSVKIAKLLTSELILSKLPWRELHVKGRPEGRKRSSLHPTHFPSHWPFLLLSALQAGLSSIHCAAPAAGSIRKSTEPNTHVPNAWNRPQLLPQGMGISVEHTSAWSEAKEADALDTQKGSTEMEIGIRFLACLEFLEIFLTSKGFPSLLWLIYYDIVLIPHLFAHRDSSVCFCRICTGHGCCLSDIMLKPSP